MFRSKVDVDKHVQDILSKIPNENERNLKGYAFARLYYNVKEYENAKVFLAKYLNIRDHHAPSHKLMGLIFEACGNFEKAIQALRRSLEIDSTQRDVLIRICDLYCKVPVDPDTALYWADKAERFFPCNDIIFTLREKVVQSEEDPDRQDFENLLNNQLATQPFNVNIRVKLLRLYLDMGRVKEAYDHVVKIEKKQPFKEHDDWYRVLIDVLELYQNEFGQELDSHFYVLFLMAIDRLLTLLMMERRGHGPKLQSPRNGDPAVVLLQFDRHLKKATEKDITSGPWLYFINHMKGQFYFHVGSLILKRGTKDHSTWKEALLLGGSVLLRCNSFIPTDLMYETWFLQMNDQRKDYSEFFHQGSARTSFVGHVSLYICKGNNTRFIRKVPESAYLKLFRSINQKPNIESSFFLSDATFHDCDLELPVVTSLAEYDKYVYCVHGSSLHHLLWLAVHQAKLGITFDHSKCLEEVFHGLQLSNPNLTSGRPESLCLLDVESFFLASLYTAEMALQKHQPTFVELVPLQVPPDVAASFCTDEQGDWWWAACSLVQDIVKEGYGERRRNLQRGLDIIRATGLHGLEVQLLMHLARTFNGKSKSLGLITDNVKSYKRSMKVTSDPVVLYRRRALHYYDVALPVLKKLADKQPIKVPRDQMFVTYSKTPAPQQVLQMIEECQLFQAQWLHDAGKYEDAIEILKSMTSQQASLDLAMAFKRCANSDQTNSSQCIAFLNKAKEALYTTLDRIRYSDDNSLRERIYVEIEEIENKLEQAQNDYDDHDGLQDSPNSLRGTSDASLGLLNRRPVNNSTPTSTARLQPRNNQNCNSNNATPSRTIHFEPSPERLDAQVQSLALTQSTLVKTLIEQQRIMMDNNKKILAGIQKIFKKLDDMHIADTHSRGQRIDSTDHGEADDEHRFEANGFTDYYLDDVGDSYRENAAATAFGYNNYPAAYGHPQPFLQQPAMPTAPPLGPYGFQPGLVSPCSRFPDARSPFYSPMPAMGHQSLPFTGVTSLPQFRFHLTPQMATTTQVPQPPVGPTQPVTNVAPVVPPTRTLNKPGTQPHAYQINLPFGSQPSTLATQPTILSMPSPYVAPAPVVMSPGVDGNVPTMTTTPTSTSFVDFHSHGFQNRLRKDSELSDTDIEHEVMGDFKPLIPLPAEVALQTGEEEEEVLCEDRAKLFRFVEKEWKERGTGIVKILKHKATGDLRLLMRRDQVLKVCANHRILPSMSILYMSGSDKALTWAAQDFAEEKLIHEQFSIRFKTADQAHAFKKAFQDCILQSAAEGLPDLPEPASLTNGISTTPKSSPASFVQQKPAGSWNCPYCYIKNASNKTECAACESLKPGTAKSITSPVTTSHRSPFTTLVTQESTVSPVRVAKDSKPEVTKPLFKPAVLSAPTTSTVVTTTSLPVNSFGGFTFSAAPVIAKVSPDEAKDREILVVTTKAKDSPQVTKLSPKSSSPFSGFSFKSLQQPSFQVSENIPVFGTASSVLNLQFSPLANDASKAFGSKALDKKEGKNESTSPGRPVADGIEPEAFVPTGEFKPVVPLPALIDVVTGEEEEEKLFGERAKLFRFDAEMKQWKERGTGELKILNLKNTKYRILMRREIVFKTCANHYILPEMTLLPSTEKALIWAAQDFSEGTLTNEQFTARFKTKEIASKFQQTFLQCQKKLKVSKSGTPTPTKTPEAKFSPLFSTATSSPTLDSSEPWECSLCYIRNDPLNSTCVACKRDKSIVILSPDSSVVGSPAATSPEVPFPGSNKPLSELFKPDVSMWECNVCYVRNNKDAVACLSCQMPRYPCSVAPTLPEDLSQKSSPFAFSLQTASANSSPQSDFISQQKDVQSKDSSSTNSSASQGFVFNSNDSNSSTTPSFVFGKSTTQASPTFNFGTTSLTNSNFKAPEPVFGTKTDQKGKPTTFTPPVSSPFQFNSSLMSANSNIEKNSTFLVTTGSGAQAAGFKFGSPQKYEFCFSGINASKSPKSVRSPETTTDPEDTDEQPSDEDIYFSPVIPLPPKVEVRTGEEEEDVLFCHRARLFRFSCSEWKERGVGELKLLLNPAMSSTRLLMRRDQVLKVCANHFIKEGLVFSYRDEKTLTWSAPDFSESSVPVIETFAVRFKTPEIAATFKDKIDTLLLGQVPAPQTPVTPSPARKSLDFSNSEPTSPISSHANNEPVAESEASTTSLGSFSFKLDGFKSPAMSSFSLASRFGASTSSTSSLFGSKYEAASHSSWSSVSVAETDPEVEIVYEAQPTLEQIEAAERLMLPRNFYLYENKEDTCPGCRGCWDYEVQYTPDKDSPVVKEETPAIEPAKESEQVPVKETTQTPEGAFFTNPSHLSFAELASSSSTSSCPVFGQSSTKSTLSFSNTVAPVFGSPALNTSSEDGVVENLDIHFEPVIPLPDLVELKTGEEDEVSFFCQRGKLFVFVDQTKEWKERGVGELKILKNKEKQVYRLLFRRDQVHKVVCNHLIKPNIVLAPLNTSNKAVCWYALDFSENEPVYTQFAVRFKNESILEEFKAMFNECKKRIEEELATQGDSTAAEKTEGENHEDEKDNDEQDDDDEEDEVIFEKRVTFEIYHEGMKMFKLAGLGLLKVLMDDDNDDENEQSAYRIVITSDRGAILCNNIITNQSELSIEGKHKFHAEWQDVNLSLDEPKMQRFRAIFSSRIALKEFFDVFEEGKNRALECEIIHKKDG